MNFGVVLFVVAVFGHIEVRERGGYGGCLVETVAVMFPLVACFVVHGCVISF